MAIIPQSLRWLLLVATLHLMGGCMSIPKVMDSEGIGGYGMSGGETMKLEEKRLDVVAGALAQLGIPYVYGGTDPEKGFDCSGLVQFAHRLAGIVVPRTAAEQYKRSSHKPIEKLKPGDLLFFKINDRTNHIAIYMGSGDFIHAPSTGSNVRVESFNKPYWRKRYRGAGSYL